MIAKRQLFHAHAFEYACALNDIDHRLTKPKHPWTTDVIDKSFLARSGLLYFARRRRRGEEQGARRKPCRAAFIVAPHLRRLCAPAGGPRGFQPATKRV